MSGPLRPERKSLPEIVAELRAQGLDEAEVEEVLVKHYGAKVEPASPFRGGTGASGSWEEEQVGTLEGLTRAFNQGVSFKHADELSAGIAAGGDALAAGVRGRNPVTAAREGYRTRVAGERQRDAQSAQQLGHAATVAELAGGVVPLIATMGGSAPTQAATRAPGLAAKMWQGAKAGSAAGAATGAGAAESLSEIPERAGLGAVLGGAAGAALPVAGAGASWLGGKARVPDAIAALSEMVAGRMPEGGRAQQTLQRTAAGLGRRGKAAEEVATRLRMDQEGGFVPTDLPAGIPSMALDRAGPNLEGLAKNVARTPGDGRTRLVGTLRGRQQQMRPSVTGKLEATTGRKAGGGIATLEQQLAARQQEAKGLYGAAVEATRGQPVSSPTLEKLRQTPIGRAAEAWAKAQRANRQEPLPRVEVPGSAPASAGGHHAPRPAAGPEVLPEYADIERGVVDNALEPTHAVELPDPELLHLMKRFLAQTAKLGARDGQQGAAAAEAQSALNVWGGIRNELPDVWRQADDAYAAASKLIDRMNQGRHALRTSDNPTGTAQRAVKESLSAVERARAKMSPEEATAHQTGAAHAVSSGWGAAGKSVQSPGRFFARSPERERQVRLAFPDDASATDFRRFIEGWDDVQARTTRVLGGSDTAGNMAEEASRGVGASALSELVRGNLGNAGAALLRGAGREAESAERQAVNRIIAEYLTSEPDALVRALGAAQTREAIGRGARRLIPGVTGQELNRW